MRNLLYSTAKKIGIELDEFQLNQFDAYREILINVNKTINLTAITDARDIVIKHFIDSISIKKFIDLNEKNVIDVGTGAGFPGLPLAIVFKNSKFTLVDSLKKRIAFLEKAIKECGISNVTAVCGRAEDLGQSPLYRGKFDFCVSRAVSAMPVLLEYCIPFLKIGAKFVSYKSTSVYEEISASINAQEKLNCELYSVETFKLPEANADRSFAIFIKKGKTDDAYPRRAGRPRKRPL